MNEEQLRELITRIVRELVAQEQPATAGRPNALVLFSGALLGFEPALEALGRASSLVNLDWSQTDAASRILDQQRIAALGMTPASESLVKSHDLLIVPTLTVNLAAKVAHGIGDCLASNVMAEFIMTGKPVVVSDAGASPDAPEKQDWFPHMPAGYQAMLRANLDALRAFGAHVARPGALDEAVATVVSAPPVSAAAAPRRATEAPAGAAIDCGQRLLTEATIKSVPAGATVRLLPGALVTALAQDAARARGITLVRS
ncbi:MAG: flavoprotein domain protein [Propionibacteriaceae bacterium]|nr:flavoprotein domain protein [Propionibacteriaceae bacterium]